MKFYNDFISMFNAQSGLNSDASVFNKVKELYLGFDVIDTMPYPRLCSVSWQHNPSVQFVDSNALSNKNWILDPDLSSRIWDITRKIFPDKSMKLSNDGIEIEGGLTYEEAQLLSQRLSAELR